MAKMTKLGSVRDALGAVADTVSVRGGVFTARCEFYYKHGFSSDRFADSVRRAVPGATILDHGEVWKAFRSGASTAKSSHWWATFTVGEVANG